MPRLAIIVSVVIIMLLAAEMAVRIRASALPPPQKWSTPDLTHKDQQIADLQRRTGASVVFLGSSSIDGALDASTIRHGVASRPAYNAGLRGGSVRMVSTWAQLVVVPRLRPEVVVLGVVSRELSGNDPVTDQREEDFFAAPATRYLLESENLLQRVERNIEDVSDLFEYRTVLRQPRTFRAFLGLSVAPVITDPNIYIAPDGQFLIFLEGTYQPSQQFSDEMRGYNLGDAQVARLRRLLTFLSERAEHVIVVNMPVTKDYVALHPRKRKDYDVFSRVLEQEAERAGAPYIDAGVWPNRFFADPVHVNSAGSRRITKIIDDEIDALPAG
jgi:hypothetical protein